MGVPCVCREDWQKTDKSAIFDIKTSNQLNLHNNHKNFSQRWHTTDSRIHHRQADKSSKSVSFRLPPFVSSPKFWLPISKIDTGMK